MPEAVSIPGHAHRWMHDAMLGEPIRTYRCSECGERRDGTVLPVFAPAIYMVPGRKKGLRA